MRFRMIAVWAVVALAGCTSISQIIAPRAPVDNPLVAPGADFETVWKATIGVVDDYFEIASEDRLARKIVTQPKIAATSFEPWAGDSPTSYDRLEATFQTLRRHAEVVVNPAPGGGFLVDVRVFKELEDMVRPDRQSAGRAVFNNDAPVNRSREIVGPVPAPAGWIPRGRDPELERKILARVRDALFL